MRRKGLSGQSLDALQGRLLHGHNLSDLFAHETRIRPSPRVSARADDRCARDTGLSGEDTDQADSSVAILEINGVSGTAGRGACPGGSGRGAGE